MDEELQRALHNYARRIDQNLQVLDQQHLVSAADLIGDRPCAVPVPVGIAEHDDMFGELCSMFEELDMQYDVRRNPQSTSRQFELLLQQNPPLKGHVRLENIRRNLQGFRTPEGEQLLPNDVQAQIIEEILACSAPLIFQEEFDANPQSICTRYGWPMSNGIMSILMPRKWGKSSLISFAICAMMMEIPSFNHLNVSVTLDQGKLITHMIRDLLQDHVRVKNKEFIMKHSETQVRLWDQHKNERLSECRASQVGHR